MSSDASNNKVPKDASNNKVNPKDASNNKVPPKDASNNTVPPKDASNNKVPPKDASNNTVPPKDASNNPVQPDASNNTVQQDDSTDTASEIKKTFDSLFTSTTITYIVWFLAVYFVAYIAMGMFFKSPDSGSSSIYQLLDLVIFGSILAYLVISYFQMTPDERDKALTTIAQDAKDYLANPYAIINVSVFLIIFHFILYLFRIPTVGAGSPLFVGVFLGAGWIVFTIALIVWFFKTFLNISLLDDNALSNLTKTADDDVTSVNGDVTPSSADEVFNIANNLYTYDDAQAVCSAYGARLATYDEVEDAYQKGGEWCNYGWSDGQMAYFPTQKATWEKLQKNPDKKNSCGRPGVNGGYMSNPYIKFGVNCYGKKPDPKADDLTKMNANKDVIVPKTADEELLDKKVQFWKDNADKLLNVNSFNRDKWSEY